MGSDSHEDDEEKTSGVEGPSSEVYSICTGGDGGLGKKGGLKMRKRQFWEQCGTSNPPPPRPKKKHIPLE